MYVPWYSASAQSRPTDSKALTLYAGLHCHLQQNDTTVLIPVSHHIIKIFVKRHRQSYRGKNICKGNTFFRALQPFCPNALPDASHGLKQESNIEEAYVFTTYKTHATKSL